MRKLMWFTVGFAAAIAMAAYILSVKWMILLVLLLLIPMVLCFFHKAISCKIVAVVLLGFIVGGLYYTVFDCLVLSCARAHDGTVREITVEATDYSFLTEYGSGVDGTAMLRGKSYSIRLYYNEKIVIKPGDQIQGAVKLRYTAPGGLEPSSYHKGEGVYLLAYAQDSVKWSGAEAIPTKYFPVVLRENISRRITEIFPEDTAAFAKALLLGEDDEIGYQEDLAYQKSGIRHVIAVSGLHVSILFSVIYFAAAGSNLLTLLLSLPVLLLFSAVAGFTPSVVRACIMQLLIILAMTFSREYDEATSLAFSALVILAVNPLAITSVSFQLSVGSMIGIFLFSRRIFCAIFRTAPFKKVNRKSRQGQLLTRIIQSISITVSAMTVTMPLCAVCFGMVSVISVVTNLLTLWIVSFVFYGIIGACVVSMLWIPAGVVLGYGVSWAIRYIQFTSRIMSQVPGGVAYTDSIYTVIWIVCTLGLMSLFYLCRKKNPMLLAGAISCLYVLSLLATWLEPRLDNLRVTVLDVGQGQCVLLQSKDSSYLLDCGGEDPEQVADIAVKAMGAQGIYELDGIILTHFDKDHANGTGYLLQAIPVKRLYLPHTEQDSHIRMELEAQSVPITWITETQKLSCGEGELTVYPSDGKEDNESSMCILYQGETCAILVTGDRDEQGESYLLQQGHLPKLDVLVVGHHGAYTAAGWELLTSTNPTVAVISVGEDNSHNHPDPFTLERLYKFGCIVRRTDQEGTIYIRG